mgnify:CR=1 FL=1
MKIFPTSCIRRKITIKRFVDAGAIDENHAVLPSDIRVNENLFFTQLVRKGRILSAGNGKYYVDCTMI